MNDDVQNLIKISTYRGLSSNEEKLLLQYLKLIPEAEALEIIKYMVKQKSFISISIAKRVLQNKDNVKDLFKYGSASSDAQSIKKWLEFAIPKIGARTTLYLLEEVNNESNRLIEKALYWLPIFISEKDIKSQNIIERLREKIKKS